MNRVAGWLKGSLSILFRVIFQVKNFYCNWVKCAPSPIAASPFPILHRNPPYLTVHTYHPYRTFIPTLHTDLLYRPYIPTLHTEPSYLPYIPTLHTDPPYTYTLHIYLYPFIHPNFSNFHTHSQNVFRILKNILGMGYIASIEFFGYVIY